MLYRGNRIVRTFGSAVVRKLGYIAAAAAVAFFASQCHAAQCFVTDSNGFLVADTTPIATCAGYVVVTANELAMMQSVFGPLDIADAATIGVAIVGAWAVAFSLRILRKMVEDA
jgi:hypothetical protein